MNVAILKESEVSPRRRKSHVDSMNREMRSLQLNCAQDKLLEMNNSRLDKELHKEYRCSRRTTRGLKQEQDHINKRTPSTEIWMRQHRDQYESWKAREREKLLKRHKSLIKSYRIPNDETRDFQMNLVRSKTFVARDRPKSPKAGILRRRSTISDQERPGGYQGQGLRKRHSVAFSDVSSRRSSVDSQDE
ncbi:hypothetical protein LOTGIDRAFT_161658 [Lottia gigantea]|uniref:Uncharacterized protein n=1 Tax=Lottia gigantea TaxID=225164 RepID=V4A9W8_LOTGI|nr:hypothetical protein LOTGIDRAFT_161658 [Lottia gigantea]ESO93552.1 hypothetical protein LOTGIDRAFT_161658 [Lottia gigantea]